MNQVCTTFEDLHQLEDAIEFLQRMLVKLAGAPKVLVVEDNDNDYFLMKRSLDKFQCEVTRVTDGEQAIEAIKSKKFDLVFLDQALPKLTGGEVLKETMGWRKDTRVILVTGYMHSPCIPKSLEAGAVMAFAKPISEEVLGLFLTPL
jgi:CheY-like chemotaxis protein